MSTNSKKSIKEKVLLSFGIVMISGCAGVSFLALGNLYSRVITNPVFYPSSWR